jgi:hypothetical protein
MTWEVDNGSADRHSNYKQLGDIQMAKRPINPPFTDTAKKPIIPTKRLSDEIGV